MTATLTSGHRIAVRVIAAILAAGAVNAFVQVPNFLPRWGNDPLLLSIQQLVVASTASFAAVGAWRARAWAWIVILAYGLLTGLLILSLGSLLELDAVERKGLWAGAAIVVTFTAALAWYLRRVTRPPRERVAG